MKDMKKLIFALLCGLNLSLPALADAPMGDWICQGNNPGDPRPYKGMVSVIKSGETYTVLWRFGTLTYIGTGIEMGDAFAISFIPSQKNEPVGLALFKKKGLDWHGRWTLLGSKTAGAEVWKKNPLQK